MIGGLATSAKPRQKDDPMEGFSEPTKRWFERSFEGPTPAQAAGWPKIASGANTLICAPTGSGKTLAAFLWGIDKLAREAEDGGGLGQGVRIVYVSPLKALSYDVERNLRAPLAGIGVEMAVGLRTGDTPQRERQAMLRTPPDILITTPESLYLMLTSQARKILTGVEAVIVDEIHAVAPTKRGAHLALTLERLDHLVQHPGDNDGQLELKPTVDEPNTDAHQTAGSGREAEHPGGGIPGSGREAEHSGGNVSGEAEHSGGGIPSPQRIGLSATQKPLERIARFLVGPGRECEVVDAGIRKELDLEIVVPVEDMADPGSTAPAPVGTADGAGGAGPPPTGPDRIDPQLAGEPNHRSIWPAIYPKLLELVREHTSTIIFVNNRRAAERLAKRLNELNAETEESQEDTPSPPTTRGSPDQPAEEDPSASADGTPSSNAAGNSAADGAPPSAGGADGGAPRGAQAQAEHRGGGIGDRTRGGEPPPIPTTTEETEIARAHHGSLAHEERSIVEELLKSGKLPCLVATSSLELGIDMGAVDLVIQVESPKSVARGMQRVGRAGHELGAVSRGRIFPKFRSDLLECAVVAKKMRAAEIEETVIPRNPLDVLAQHLVSMVADREWDVDEVERVVKGAEPYEELSREQLENVLDMLDGRYPSERFAELRPRLVWDRTAGTIRGRKGARQLAVTNAGTIPDRGLYGVHLPDGRRVGELDEEMVYEARPGQVFLLGASTWRIDDITRDRVIVTPAPGVPGAVPFWRGDGVGRTVELGRAIGAFSREAVSADPEELAAEYDLDRLAAENLVAYLREQQTATRVVPSDETIVIERFRDEIGDWRLCILSPFGGRVHAAWGLALSARIRDEFELEADAIWSDDGIVVHLPDADEAPSPDLVTLEPDEVEDLIVGELSGSALFGARFREAAGRSLLIPRAYPGKRTPLWQQRLKAQSLLEVAREFPRFPVTLETYREVLKDVLDLPALVEILRDIRSRRITLVEVETQTASPFASSLLFDYVATYMYEGDTPNAERRAAALALDRDLLRELLGQEELRELIDPAALDELEDSLQHRTEEARAADRDQLEQILRRLGDLGGEEVEQRVAEGYSGASMLGKLESERRAVKVRIAGEDRWIAAQDGGLYRDALGVPVPSGLPESFLEQVPEPLPALMRRYARTHGPFPAAQASNRYGVDAEPALKQLERAGDLVRGELLPGGTEREWCDPDVLRRVRRASLAVLRKEVEAADVRELARFLPSWQNVDAHRPAGAGPDRLREALVPLQGVALTPEVWERDVLPRRLGAYSQSWLDQLTTGGEIVWIGAGPVGRTGRVALYFREDVRLAGPPPANAKLDPPQGEIHDAIRELLTERPAFWLDIEAALADREKEELHSALWDLAWAGEVTNDAFAPLRAPRLRAVDRAEGRRTRRFSARRAAAGQAVQGRWSLVSELLREAPPAGPRWRAQAELMLERYGIVTRETVLSEGVPGGFSTMYGELSNLEILGTARRGYFVEGLGGAQFALAGAVERLRSLPRSEGEHLILAATDPAQPYGAQLPWPKPPLREAEPDEGSERRGGRRPSRVAGAYVLLRDGEPILYVERGGKGILRLTRIEGEELATALSELTDAAVEGLIPKLAIERVDGEPVIGSGFEEALVEAGFSRQPKRLVASA
jgi:ATP-dependent Lhr-like helicase